MGFTHGYSCSSPPGLSLQIVNLIVDKHLDLLSDLVADYEEVHFPIEAPTLVDVIKLRMYTLRMPGRIVYGQRSMVKSNDMLKS